VRPDLDAVAVRRLIIDSVDSLPALAGVVAAGGRVNAGRAVAAATGTDDPDGGGWWRYLETVQRFYVAYYHRPADPGGLLYWSSYLHAVGGDTTEMVAAFANSNEAMARYGEITAANIAQVVDDIYQAAFGRDAEPAGRRYYVDGFNVGTFTPATIMLNVIDGARGEDALVLRNRLRAADDFTFFIDPDLDGNDYCISYSGEEDVLAAREFLAAVTADDNTLPTHAELTAFMRTRINEYPLPASR
jgi:hypothetical protein